MIGGSLLQLPDLNWNLFLLSFFSTLDYPEREIRKPQFLSPTQFLLPIEHTFPLVLSKAVRSLLPVSFNILFNLSLSLFFFFYISSLFFRHQKEIVISSMDIFGQGSCPRKEIRENHRREEMIASTTAWHCKEVLIGAAKREVEP